LITVNDLSLYTVLALCRWWHVLGLFWSIITHALRVKTKTVSVTMLN